MAEIPEDILQNPFGTQDQGIVDQEQADLFQQAADFTPQPEPEQAPQEQSFKRWDEIKDDPNYEKLEQKDKEQIFSNWKQYAIGNLSKVGALSTEEDAKTVDDFFNSIAETENFAKARSGAPSYVGQLIEQGQSGLNSLQSGVVGYGAAIGAADPAKAAEIIASNNLKTQSRYVSPEMQEYGAKNQGFFEAAKDIVTNPIDIMLPMFAQSIGSNLPAMGASLVAGATAGAVAAPPTAGAATPAVGIAVGLGTSAVLGGVTDTLVSFDQLVNEEVRKRGIDPLDPKAIQSVLEDSDFQKRAVAYASTRGAVITATELGALGLGSLIAGPAVKAAETGIREAVTAGKLAKEFAKQVPVQAAAEGVGEAAAQASAQVAVGEKVNVEGKQVAEEIFAGLPMSGLQGAGVAYKSLIENNSPVTADEDLRQKLVDYKAGEYAKILSQPATDENIEKFYNGLTIGEKAKILGVEGENAVLTGEQNLFNTLAPGEKTRATEAFKVGQVELVNQQQQAKLEKAEIGATPPVLEPPVLKAPAPVVETPAPVTEPPVLAPTPEALVPAVTPEAPATIASPTDPLPVTPAAKVVLAESAPATLQVVQQQEAPAPAPVAPAPTPAAEAPAPAVALAPTNRPDLIERETPLTDTKDIFNFTPQSKDVKTETDTFTAAGVTIDRVTLTHTPTGARLTFNVLKSPVDGKIKHISVGRMDTPAENRKKGGATTLLKELKAYADSVNLPIYSGALSKEAKSIFDKEGFRVGVTPYDFPLGEQRNGSFPEEFANMVYDPKPVAPTPAQAPKKLPPTKKQVTALTKLGYLPADIEGLDRTQAKDILANQIEKQKTQGIEAEAPATGQPGVAQAQPAVGEAGQPVAPATTEPTTQVPVQERLDKAKTELEALIKKIGAELGELELDAESVSQYFGGTLSPQNELQLRALLNILNHALANAQQTLKVAEGRGRTDLKKTFTNLKKVKLRREGYGGGVYANPRDVFNLDTLYLDPDQLLRSFASKGVSDPASFFVKALSEEVLHANHGLAMYQAFLQTNPATKTQEAFQAFYDAQNKEIENSLSLDQIKEIVGKYAQALGVTFEGKTKEQVIAEFNKGRPGRLAEEYLRGLIQQRITGSMTEDTLKAFATRPILRSLGALRNYFAKLIGLGTKRESRKTYVDKYYDAIVNLLTNSSPSEIRAASQEAGSTIPGSQLASSIDPNAILQSQETSANKKALYDEVAKELGPKNKETGEGGLWRLKVIGGLKRAFRTTDPNDVESAVYASIPEAVETFNPEAGTKFESYLFQIARQKILEEKEKLTAQRALEYSLQAPGFVNSSMENLQAEREAEALQKAREELTLEDVEDKVATETGPKTLEEEVKTADQKIDTAIEKEVAQETGTLPTNIAEDEQEIEEVNLADGEQISAIDAEIANKRTARMEAELGEAGRLLADAAKNLNLTKMEVDILQFTADPKSSPLTRAQLSDKYGLNNIDFDEIRDDVIRKMREQLVAGGVTRTADVLASSIDPNFTQALNRALRTMPEDVVKALAERTYIPFTDDDVINKANKFVDENSPGGDVMHAKRILDGVQNMPFEERVGVLGVIGKRLRNALFAHVARMEANGTTPEGQALRQYLSNNLTEVLSRAQDLGTRAGQDLRSMRMLASMFLPYEVAKLYTGPISEQQKAALANKEEVTNLLAEIEKLKATIAGLAIDEAVTKVFPRPIPPGGPTRPGGIYITPPEDNNFFKLLSAFGDLAPLENETFEAYLQRIGIPYDELMLALEDSRAAAVGPEGVAPVDFKKLSASEAIEKLLAKDKNLFSKLVSLRLKTNRGSETTAVQENFTKRKADAPALKQRNQALQLVFDFFNTTQSEKPSSQEAVEEAKDNLPPLVRLAKYASDVITGRVIRSLGVTKENMPKGSFEKLENQIRKMVNAQFKQELDPKKAATEDARPAEQRLLDMVQRIKLAEQVFNEVQANLQGQLNEDNRIIDAGAEGRLSPEQRKNLEELVAKKFDVGKVAGVDSLLKKLIDFKAEARKHMTQRGASLQSILSLIREKLPELSEQQANDLATQMAERYEAIVKKDGQRQLENIVKRVGERASRDPKTTIQQLMELINLGAFDQEKFYNAIADRFNLPTWDPAVVDKIKGIADQMEKMPEGSDQRATKGVELQALIAEELYKQEKGWDAIGRKLDVAAAIWKAGVLSGPPTQLVNLGATHLNVLFELLTEARAYYKASKAIGKKATFGEFFNDALNAYVQAVGKMGVEQASDAFATGLSRFRNETQSQLSPLEMIKFDQKKPWNYKNYLAAWKIVGRAMAAADTYNSVIANEAKTRMAARYALMKDGLTSEQATKKLNELFDNNSTAMKAIEDQVGREEAAGQFGTLAGLKPSTMDYASQKRKIEAGRRRRYLQLREQYIADEGKIGNEGIAKIRNFTQKATFNNQPTGMIGYLGEAVIGQIAGKTKLLTPFAAFPRTIANIINSGLDYTPYGWARANGFSLGNLSPFIRNSNYAFEKPEKGSVEYHQLQAKAFFGSLVTFSIIGMAMRDMDKDWDEAYFAVTGRGPTDANKREQLRQSGWTENTVKIGPLRFKHTDFPGLNLVFGSLALVSDQWRYGNLSEKDFGTVAATAALSVGNTILDKNLLSGAKVLFDAVSEGGEPGDKAKRLLQSYTGGYLNPGMARWLTKTLNIGADGKVGVVDYKELNSTTGGWLIGQTPLAVVFGKPMLNRLGEEIRDYPWTATSKRLGFLPEVKEHPVFTPLIRAGLFVPGASINSKIKDFKGNKLEQRKMTREEYYDYSKYNGEYLKRILTPATAQALANVAQTNQAAAQKRLEDLAQRARDYATARIETQIRSAKK
jgi:DNA-directed RNA polymerase specialized sigma24 family protein